LPKVLRALKAAAQEGSVAARDQAVALEKDAPAIGRVVLPFDPMQLAVNVQQAEIVGRKRLLDPAVAEHDLVGREGVTRLAGRERSGA
jgi:hypothetical protein